MRPNWNRIAAGIVAAGTLLFVPQARSEAPAEPEVTEAHLAALLARVNAQQERLGELETRLAAARGQETENARAEAMRQQIREVLSEQEFRESLMPSMMQAGYDDGFFIRSSDDKFRLSVYGRLQLRWTHYATRADNRWLVPRLQRNDRTGFDVERLRVGFCGHAYTPDLTYCIELEADNADGYMFVPGDAWVDYRFCDAFHVLCGYTKLMSTRAQVTSDANLQFIDRPMTDAVFGLGYGVLVRFWGSLFDNKLDYYLDVANSVTEGEGVGIGRTITPDPSELDGNPALLFRTVWHALGDQVDFGTQADHEISASPGLDLGFHYAFNEDEGDNPSMRLPYPLPRNPAGGGYGLVTSNGTQINQFGFDAAFKWRGFSATGEYILRLVDPRRAWRQPFTAWWRMTGQDATTVQHGAYVQAGYFLPIPGMEKKLEVVARVGGVSALASRQEGSWEYSGGLNYYLKGDKVKLQTDLTRIYEVPINSTHYSLANVNDNALIWRVQLQVAF